MCQKNVGRKTGASEWARRGPRHEDEEFLADIKCRIAIKLVYVTNQFLSALRSFVTCLQSLK